MHALYGAILCKALHLAVHRCIAMLKKNWRRNLERIVLLWHITVVLFVNCTTLELAKIVTLQNVLQHRLRLTNNCFLCETNLAFFYRALFVDCVEEVYYAWATTSPSYKLQITSKIDHNFWQKAKLYQKAKKTKSITNKNGKIGKRTEQHGKHYPLQISII